MPKIGHYDTRISVDSLTPLEENIAREIKARLESAQGSNDYYCCEVQLEALARQLAVVFRQRDPEFNGYVFLHDAGIRQD